MSSCSFPVQVVRPRAGLYHEDGMAWTVRENSKSQIDRAGKALIELPVGDQERERAIEIVDNWRRCHAYPLHIIHKTLKSRASKINTEAFTAQRQKRLPSIVGKLRDSRGLRLTQIQDIGGCRAVMPTVDESRALARLCDVSQRKGRPNIEATDDYVESPKPDGYRSVHLIYRYDTDSDKQKEFNGQRIEVQIRTQLQHIWATTVETAHTFSGQALKSKVKSAKEEWLRLFALVSSSMSETEKTPLVPDTPRSRVERAIEIREIVNNENMIGLLHGYSEMVSFAEDTVVEKAAVYLLVLDLETRKLKVSIFPKDLLVKAQERYAELEKQYESNRKFDVVLVSVDSIAALRKAYPNYYSNTREFIKFVEDEIRIGSP